MLRFFLFLTIAVGLSTVSNAKIREPVSPEEEAIWRNYLLPLPHEIEFHGKTELSPAEISVSSTDSDDAMVRHAVGRLKSYFAEKAGSKTNETSFKIIVGIIDSDGKLNGETVYGSKRLNTLPNKEQAYLIIPLGDTTLLLTALSGKGLNYAVSTLIQLLEADPDKSQLTVPIVKITDWPDMEERGLWNFPDPADWIPWLSSMKLNYGKMAGVRPAKVVKGKANTHPIHRESMLKARSMGFNYVPLILHLNFLHDYGLFSAYPELAGVGDSALAGRYFAHKEGNQHRAPCAKNPLLTEIMTEWMKDIASQDANEVSCWLSERPAQCGHEECIREGQFVLEARAFINAWRETKKVYPDFQIRLFISTTSNERYDKVLAETPKEVRLERCCSTDMERVRMMPRDKFTNPLFDKYAADGWWVAQYDVPIGAYGRVETPEFKLPSTTAHRIKDYVTQLHDRKYQGAYGMIAWANKGVETCGYNIHALAEWSWNAEGRTERDFAIAWATRAGFDKPDAFADWSDIVGSIEFDVYESDFPTCYSWGKMTDMIKTKERPILGEGIFRYYSSISDFDDKIERLTKAREIASSFKDPYFMHETDIIVSYVRLAREIFRIGSVIATDAPLTVETKAELREMLSSLKEAGDLNAVSTHKWRSELGPEPWHHRVHDAIKAVDDTVENISGIIKSRHLN